MRPSGIFNTSYNQDMAIIRTNLQWVLFIALIVALFALPLLYQGYWIGFLVFVGISAITALGLMLLSGYCGQISLGHSAFMGVGGLPPPCSFSSWGSPSGWPFQQRESWPT